MRVLIATFFCFSIVADQLKMKISVERCETSEKPSLTKGQVISM